MEDYEVATVPFCESSDPSVTLLKAVSLTENRLPVVVKRFEFTSLLLKSTQQSITQAINAAVIQAKIHHPNAREILEVRFGLEEDKCSLYHVFDSEEHNLSWEIESRRKRKKPFTETEVHTVLRQMSDVLVCAHSQVIATQGFTHKDLKPNSIAKIGDDYKLGDFGCYFAKRASFLSSNTGGNRVYMSPQARSAYEEGQYDPYKADVFSLGLILLEMATLVKPADLNPVEQVDVFVARRLAKLRVSREFKDLLRVMLSEVECQRPSMEAIRETAKELVAIGQERLLLLEEERRVSVVATVQQPLAYVEQSSVKVFNFHKKAWEAVPLNSPICADEGSRYVWVAGQLFCSGGKGDGKGRNEAYLLGREGIVARLADMLLPRFGHGLWWHCARQCVLTFGGIPLLRHKYRISRSQHSAEVR